MASSGRGARVPSRRTLFDGLDDRNLFCARHDLTNEASVERFFCDRLLHALGYRDHQIKPKTTLSAIAIGHGRQRENYKPDYAMLVGGKPRWILDAKHPDEDPDRCFLQGSGYALALNQMHDTNPVQYFVLSNGYTTLVYRWDSDSPVLRLDFADFSWGRSKFEQLRELLVPTAVTKETTERLTPSTITLARPTQEKARHIFAQCHRAIWKAEVCGPSAAFMAFVKVMFVKLWADRQLRNQHDLSALEGDNEVTLPADRVTFSVQWIETRESEGAFNPIDTILFASLRDQIEQDIQDRRKKRIFELGEGIGLQPDTIKEVVRRLEGFDLFGIDEDLNGRLFETFLSATMRGQELGQFFTPRSVVKMMADLANLTVTPVRQDRVIDACCGTGGFLIEALTIMRNRVRDNRSLSTQQKEELIDQVCTESLFGIDAGSDPPIARIARINMYLHGDGGTRVYYCDALDKEVQPPNREPEAVTWASELREDLQELQFDVALTNPPFSMTKEKKNPAERRVLEQYELARIPRTATTRASLRSNVMFFERYHGLLRPRGRPITVIDETLLANPTFEFVRDFIRKRFLIRAIISLPGNAFRRQGSRVKTSVLVLEKRCQDDEGQPDCFGYFSLHLGVDDLAPRATIKATRKARDLAKAETTEIVSGFRAYLNGNDGEGVIVPSGQLSDRLDLKYVVGQTGRMATHWKDAGLDVRALKSIATPIEAEICPADYPDQRFKLVSISYDGFCRVEKEQFGDEIRAAKMLRLSEGVLVFSTIRATDGAIAVASPEVDGALVSATSYILLDCGDRETTEYVRGILKSYEIRSDLQSLSHGSSRYETKWKYICELEIPWPAPETIRRIGSGFIRAEARRRQAERSYADAKEPIADLGVESDSSKERFTQSKAPT